MVPTHPEGASRQSNTSAEPTSVKSQAIMRTDTTLMVILVGALMFIAGWSIILLRPDAQGWPLLFSVFTVVSGSVALLRGAAGWRRIRRASKKVNRKTREVPPSSAIGGEPGVGGNGDAGVGE